MQRILSFLQSARRGSSVLYWTSLGAGGVLVLSLILQVIDPRLVNGVPTWLKPAKFGLSTLFTGLALAWMVDQMGPISRGMRRAARVIAVIFAIEMVLVTAQAARGVASHFNLLTVPDALVFQAMGAAITVFWFAQLWLTGRAFRHRFVDTTFGWGIRMGLLIATVGGGLGFIMAARPTPAQLANLQAGQPTMVGAHSVGVEDGQPGLPGTRWNTVGGDLRVAHFIGLHALQILPLAGAGLSRRRKPGRDSAHVMGAVATGYAGLMATALVGALRGVPVLSPDAGTWFMVGAVGALCAAQVAWGVLRAPVIGQLATR